MLGFSRAVDRPLETERLSQMRKMGLKALTAILTIGRRSRRHVDWTLAIAIISTIVTVVLIALYFLQDSADFR
jgi:hypothetical protein